MPTLTTTRMSSKGQVVIPEEIRDRLGLQSGTQFVVVGDRDVVILKAISAPSMKEFDKLIAQARQQARKSGLKKSDIDTAVERFGAGNENCAGHKRFHLRDILHRPSISDS